MLLVITPIFNTNSVSAASAPRLTEVRVVAITSDGNDFVWENIASNQLKANNPLEGETLYLKVLFMGYPKTFLASSGGENLYPHVTKYDSVALEDRRTRIAYGFYYYLKVPMESLPYNNIRITGIDHMLGTQILANPISFDKVGG